jgi:alpha-beta hydrolase superfamily lysophospholipase
MFVRIRSIRSDRGRFPQPRSCVISRPAHAPIPVIRSALTLPTADGKAELYIRRYDPVRNDSGRTLVLIHGAGEYGGRYEHFISRVASAGWSVIAGDLRGHGRSGGIPTHLDSFDQYLNDLDLIWSHFQLVADSTSVFAHSMGGLVAVRFAQTRQNRMRALVLSAPLLALKVRVRLFKRAFGRLCHMVAPTTRFQTVVKTSDITRNLLARASRATDPLMRRSITAGWYFSVRRALLQSLREADRFTLPLLLLQGEADQIVDPHWPAQWIQRIASSDCTLRMLPGQYHEVLHEPEWEQITGELLQWLEQRFSPAGERPAAPATSPALEPLIGNRLAA